MGRLGLQFLSVGLFSLVLVPSVPNPLLARDSQSIAIPGIPAGEPTDDRPVGIPSSLSQRAPGDTLAFGYVDGDGFAILGDVWTFDHGGADPFEGWTAVDVTEQVGIFGRHLTSAIWDADPFHTLPAPVLTGNGSAWIGAFQSEARDLCWDDGIGYGDSWCQRLVSPVLTRGSTSDVDMSWVHFNDTEDNFDYTEVYVERLPSGERVDLRQYTGQIGLALGHPADSPVGAVDSLTLVSADFAGETAFRLVFEMTSDGSWSDEDGLYSTEYGPMSVDDVVLTEEPGGGILGSYGFESGLDGWTAAACPGIGTFFGVAPLTDYILEDTCDCDLAGNVIELHDENGEHPEGQHLMVVSPPVDVVNDVLPLLTGPGSPHVLAEWDQYSDMPRADGVFYRPGWQYFPWVCEVTGAEGWSPRVGQDSYFFTGEDPSCTFFRNNGSTTDVPVPGDAEQVRFIYELYSSCDAFGIPGDCSGETNFTPILDNIEIRFTQVPNAPQFSIDLGLQFQDGFAQNTLFNDPNMPGRADVARNIGNFQNYLPYVLGDSLGISGPAVLTPDDRWEARLWFRIPRVGPGADARYTTWRDRVADGFAIDPVLAGDGNPVEFTFALMDSTQLGTNAYNRRFVSYFREDDDDFDSGEPELRDGNEIIADDVLFPGTQVEYFLTSNYLNSPSEFFHLPDTTGGFFLEFEILPSWRDVEGSLKYPCFLYIDNYNAGAQEIIEDALDLAGIEHDRYDYLTSGFLQPPMDRGFGLVNNNGCTLLQLLGYRGLLVNTGLGTGEFWPEDYSFFGEYLTSVFCDGDGRGIIYNGANPTEWMERAGRSILGDRFGAAALSTSYREYSGDEAFCVQLEAPSGGGEIYGTSHTGADYEYGAYGSGCPTETNFDVLTPVGTGVGNRVFVSEGGGIETAFAQIVNEYDGPPSFRTVLDGTSWHVLAGRDEFDTCDISRAQRVEAAANEIRAAVEWIYGATNIPSLCVDPCANVDPAGIPGSVGGFTATTQLHPSVPNPFHPRTTLHYTLAVDGPVRLTIHDVTGRQVRSLVDGTQTAGAHDLIWDGTDDRGARLASGTYWASFKASGRRTASRLVLLK